MVYEVIALQLNPRGDIAVHVHARIIAACRIVAGFRRFRQCRGMQIAEQLGAFRERQQLMHGGRRVLGQHVDIVALDAAPHDGHVTAGVVLTAEPPKHDIPHAGRVICVLFLKNTPLGDTVKLTKKDNSRTVIGTLLDATIVTIDDNYHKGVVVRPDYVYENVEFSLAEWNIEVIPNSSDNNFVEF